MTTQPPISTLVYVGTYTETLPFIEGKAEGIYRYQLDLTSGALKGGSTAAETPNPSYLAIAPNQRYLYAVDEREDGQVRAFAIDPATGDLTFLNQQSSHGETPAHISVDHSGQWVMVANYDSGSSSILPIQADGSLGPASDIIQHEGHGIDTERQAGPHAHCIIADPTNRFVLIADLGIDKVMLYSLDTAQGKLVPNDPPWAAIQAGAGPRSLAIHPNGRYIYLIDELD